MLTMKRLALALSSVLALAAPVLQARTLPCPI